MLPPNAGNGDPESEDSAPEEGLMAYPLIPVVSKKPVAYANRPEGWIATEKGLPSTAKGDPGTGVKTPVEGFRL
jgi:hypothetical protein